MDIKVRLKEVVEHAIATMLKKEVGLENLAVPAVVIQETPADKPGDYGTPAAFSLAKALKKNPVAIAADLLENLELPAGISRAEAVGPYLNFFVDVAGYIESIVRDPLNIASKNLKVIVEHTSVNPNKELHVGHLRNVVLGDAMARIYREAGYTVEVQNYIDDTGRQAADSIFAAQHYGAVWDGIQKYDHWLGELYVRLHQDLKDPEIKAALEPQIREVIHQLERGELRSEIEKVVKAQLETCYALGVEYDLLVWESDIVGSGFLDKAMKILEKSEYCSHPLEGKYKGCFVMDTSHFLPGLEDPILVLLRSDGTATYTSKDVAQQFWKFGLFEGLDYLEFEIQPSGKKLYTTHKEGSPQNFAHANRVINVIDSRQGHPQMSVKASMAIAGYPNAYNNSIHLSYNTVSLEGQAISGRKGITVPMDQVMQEAKSRAADELAGRGILEKLADPDKVSFQVGLGGLRFSMLKSERTREIDFQWDAALSLVGDNAVYIQYAAARANSILKKANEVGLDATRADYTLLGNLELELVKEIARFPMILENTVRDNSPHHVAHYGLELASTFNGYFNHKSKEGKPDTKVIDSSLPDGLQCARLAVVERMFKALESALGVLGIEVPAEM
jgi:arginyl-tRNA synthetase